MKKSHKQATETVLDNPAVEAAAAKQRATHVDESAESSKKGKAIKNAQPDAKPASDARSKSDSENGQLVCRYCGSDDLGPSFIKRRDARCRACFKQRYGSAQKAKRNAAA